MIYNKQSSTITKRGGSTTISGPAPPVDKHYYWYVVEKRYNHIQRTIMPRYNNGRYVADDETEINWQRWEARRQWRYDIKESIYRDRFTV
jgi:hypothetical protein